MSSSSSSSSSSASGTFLKKISFRRTSHKKKEEMRRLLEHKMHSAQMNPEPVFDLSECEVSRIPSGVYAMCRVYRKEELLMNSNSLTDVPDDDDNRLSDLKDLKRLHLSDNLLVKLPPQMSLLTRLEELYLNHNNLKHIPDCLSQLPNLQVVEVKDNNLTQFPTVFCILRGLKRIDIRNNSQITALPTDLVKLTKLREFLLDCNTVTYPPKSITEQGLVSLMEFLKSKCDSKFIADNEVFQNIDLNDATVTEDINDSLQEEKKQELLQWERQLKSENTMQADMSARAQEKKRLLLNELTNEQISLFNDLKQLQAKKVLDKASLIVAINLLEDHSKKLIQSLNRWDEKRKQQDAMLQEMEDYNRMLFLRQDKQITLRKTAVIKSIEKFLEDGLDEYSLCGSKFEQLMKNRDSNKEVLCIRLQDEEDLQREAFDLLQRNKDAQHQFISNQIKLVERELATLTRAEVQRKSYKLDSIVNDVGEQRTTLAYCLLQLLKQREVREEELRARLLLLEEQKEEVADQDRTNFWLIQYQRLMNIQPLEPQLSLNQVNLEDELLKRVLLNCDKDKILPYLHVFTAQGLTFEQLKHTTEKELMRMGIDNYEVALMVVDAVNDLSRELDAFTPSAPLEDSVESLEELEPSAPSIKMWCELECVVCLDVASNTVFLPCGHCCACSICCHDLQLCPLCREAILSKRSFHPQQ